MIRPKREGLPLRGKEHILAILEASNIFFELRSFTKAAHHAGEAAELLGCSLGAVVKSLVFQIENTDQILIVLVSGKNQADPAKLMAIIGHPVHPAKAADVPALTGFSVGSVPPIGFDDNFPVIIDNDLMNYNFIWAACGSANDLIRLSLESLLSLTQGKIEEISFRHTKSADHLAE